MFSLPKSRVFRFSVFQNLMFKINRNLVVKFQWHSHGGHVRNSLIIIKDTCGTRFVPSNCVTLCDSEEISVRTMKLINNIVISLFYI